MVVWLGHGGRRGSMAMLADLYIYFGVALAGLVSFLSPCVLPLVPPYLGFLGGTTLEELTAEDGVEPVVWRRVVVSAILFVLGFTTVFVALGASASVLGQFIQVWKRELSAVAGVVIILFGLHFLGVFKVPLFHREARYTSQADGTTLAGAYLIGLAFAFGWTPCIGPILSTVLTLAMNERSLMTGVSLLFVYSLGLGIPFVLAAVAIRPFLGFLKRFRRHLGVVEKVMGVVLVVTGLMFIFGGINWFGQWLIENVPILSQLEELLTSKGLQSEILKKGGGQ